MTSFSLGDLKIAAGRTNGIVGVGQYSKRIVFPSGLFSQAPYFVANISTAHGSVTGNLIIGNNVSKDDASVYWSNTTGNGSVGGVVSWIAIGS